MDVGRCTAVKIRSVFRFLAVLALVAAALWMPDLLLDYSQRQASQQVYRQDASGHLLSNTTLTIVDKLLIAADPNTALYSGQTDADDPTVLESVTETLGDLLDAGAISPSLFESLLNCGYFQVRPGFLVAPDQGVSFEVYTVEFIGSAYAVLTLDAGSLQILSLKIQSPGALDITDFFQGDLQAWARYYGLASSDMQVCSYESFIQDYETPIKGQDTDLLLAGQCTFTDENGQHILFTVCYDPSQDCFYWGAKSMGGTAAAELAESLSMHLR